MNDMAMLMGAALGGVVLGALFFGGLWWTVRRSLAARAPALWLLASLLLRMAGALAGIYMIGAGDWRRLLVCLLGFVGARLLALRLCRAPVEAPDAA
ncbi:F1F0 ATPase subunit 2 [Oxalobacteraceae bacterium GrIS 1.11]